MTNAPRTAPYRRNPMEYLETFHDDDTNMTSVVFVSGYGGFAAALIDDDSGEVVGSRHKLATQAKAAEAAKNMLRPTGPISAPIF